MTNTWMWAQYCELINPPDVIHLLIIAKKLLKAWPKHFLLPSGWWWCHSISGFLRLMRIKNNKNQLSAPNQDVMVNYHLSPIHPKQMFAYLSSLHPYRDESMDLRHLLSQLGWWLCKFSGFQRHENFIIQRHKNFIIQINSEPIITKMP